MCDWQAGPALRSAMAVGSEDLESAQPDIIKSRMSQILIMKSVAEAVLRTKAVLVRHEEMKKPFVAKLCLAIIEIRGESGWLWLMATGREVASWAMERGAAGISCSVSGAGYLLGVEVIKIARGVNIRNVRLVLDT